MYKILTVANREYRAIVGTKAFVLSLAIMPVLMFGGMLAIRLLQDKGGIEEKKIAVLDFSGQFKDALQNSADAHNSAMDQLASATDKSADGEDRPPTVAKGFKYLLEFVSPTEQIDQQRLDLSNRVRKQEIYAFLEIPNTVTESGAAAFYSEDTGLSPVRSWIADRINERVKQIRYQSLGLDATTIQKATQPVNVKAMGLVQVKSDGSIQTAEEKNVMVGMFVPMIIMMLMFMVIFMSSQPMLESVLEEKSQRIAEVLLGSVSPSQLMAGKLLGSVGGSLTIVAVYFIGGYFFAHQKGYTDYIPLNIIPWFIVFQILGVMFYASIFLAVGSSVSQLKEAQSMLLPVWMLLMCPMFVWFMIVQDPNGSLAFWFSMFPPATPTTMVLRMGTGVTVPIWQPIIGIILLIVATAACVTIAGRIFRIGILWQGKTPKVSELLRWAISG